VTQTEVKLGAILLLAFLTALFALGAAPTNQVLNTRSGGCPEDGQRVVAAGEDLR
jgi:hypothetical protein